MEIRNCPMWNNRSSAPGPLPKKERRKKERNKAEYAATSCGRVGRGGYAHFSTFRLLLTDGRTDGRKKPLIELRVRN